MMNLNVCISKKKLDCCLKMENDKSNGSIQNDLIKDMKEECFDSSIVDLQENEGDFTAGPGFIKFEGIYIKNEPLESVDLDVKEVKSEQRQSNNKLNIKIDGEYIKHESIEETIGENFALSNNADTICKRENEIWETDNTVTPDYLKFEGINIKHEPVESVSFSDTEDKILRQSPNKDLIQSEVKETFFNYDNPLDVKKCYSDSENLESVCKADYEVDGTNSTVLSDCVKSEEIYVKYETVEADGLSTMQHNSYDNGTIKPDIWQHDDLDLKDGNGIDNNSETESKSDETKNVSLNLNTSEKPIYRCNLCPRFTTEWEIHLKNHMIVHKDKIGHEIGKYKCSVCDYSTNHKGTLNKHSVLHLDPSEKQIYKCSDCDYTAYKKHLLRSHSKVHKSTSEENMYKCALCDYKTKVKFHIKRHMLVHTDSSKVEMHKCTTCNFMTKYTRDLKRHMLVHADPSDKIMYKCDICSYTTHSKYNLKPHILTHKEPHNKPHKGSHKVIIYRCEECEYETKFRSSLKAHKSTHQHMLEPTMYSCTICDYKTKGKGNMKFHRLLHKDPSQIQTYKCASCDFTTNHKGTLNKHKLQHLDPSERQRHKCGECDYATHKKYLLTRHSKVHKNIPPVVVNTHLYKCTMCKYKTRIKYHMTRHMLIHRDSSKI